MEEEWRQWRRDRRRLREKGKGDGRREDGLDTCTMYVRRRRVFYILGHREATHSEVNGYTYIITRI